MREMRDSGIEWIGEIPADWNIVQVRYLFKIGRGRVIAQTELQDDGMYPVFSSQTKDNGCLGYINTYDFDVSQLTWTTDGANAGTVFLRSGKHNCTNVCGTLQPLNSEIDLIFQKYALEHIAYYHKRADTNGFKIMNNEMADIHTILPPLEVQHRIADYLDRKCSQIDTIIARQQEVIEKLKAYKLSVITEAVTKGLNPNVPMKDSGVEWIGEIPEHWQVPKIKYLATIASGGTPDRSHPEYWNGSINWAKTGELQNNELYETEEKITELALENSSAKVFSVDTILVAMYGQGKTRGMTALLKVPSATNQACAGITVYSKDITVSYLWLFLMGAYDAIREKANGSGQPNLSGALIADFNVTLPPIEEQMNICKTVAMRLPHIDSIIKQKEIIVDKLTAYKKSLIYEVVTGKKEV